VDQVWVSVGPVQRRNAWVLENKRLALRYDRLGFIVQSLLEPPAYSWLRDASPRNSENRLLASFFLPEPLGSTPTSPL
jgi:hypothetical protein